MKTILQLSWIFGAAAILAVFLPSAVLAADFRVAENLSLSSEEELSGNLYVAGGLLSVSALVPGDLFGAGGNVNLVGPVNKDAVLVAGKVVVTGNILEDLRVVGGNVDVMSVIGGELLAAGGNVSILPQANVSGDATIVGGLVVWSGSGDGDLVIWGGEVRVDGTVAGNLDVYADERVTLGPSASIGGDFNYRAPQAAVMEDGATVAGVTEFAQVESRVSKPARKHGGRTWAAAAFTWWLVKLVAIFLTAWILYLLFGRRHEEFLLPASTTFWREAGIGFAGLILTPIAAVIAIATVIGAILGFVTLLGYGIILLLLSSIGTLIIGSWLTRKIYKKKATGGNGRKNGAVAVTEMPWQMIFLGALIWQLLKLVPVLGWIVLFLLTLVAFGLVLDFKMKVIREFAAK